MKCPETADTGNRSVTIYFIARESSCSTSYGEFLARFGGFETLDCIDIIAAADSFAHDFQVIIRTNDGH